MNTPTAIEINFDGLVGPTHNFAALSLGNIASAKHGGQTSSPRDAALEGLEKMRTLLRLGLTQGFLPPLRRPAAWMLSRLGYHGSEKEMLAEVAQRDPELLARISSASAMWTANAATVIAAPDSADGRVHLITANLSTMFHRAIEQEETAAKLARVFADARRFVVRPALPLGAHLGDEGAANHMRIAPSHGERGTNVFVYGEESGRFPARQAERASRAVARIGGLAEDDALFVRQASAAVQAGAFHNDVVAVANENVLLCHAQAFEGGVADEARIAARLPGLYVLRVENLSLDEAVQTYLFNSQLLTLPGEDAGMALILPIEAREHEGVWREVEAILGADNPVKQAIAVDVRGSMKNGGGPACLRLRVPVSQDALAGINPAYLLNEARLDALAKLVETYWPNAIAPSDLADPALWDTAYGALAALEDWITRSG